MLYYLFLIASYTIVGFLIFDNDFEGLVILGRNLFYRLLSSILKSKS